MLDLILFMELNTDSFVCSCFSDLQGNPSQVKSSSLLLKSVLAVLFFSFSFTYHFPQLRQQISLKPWINGVVCHPKHAL